MFTVLTDLSLLVRRDLSIDAASPILISGLQGYWVTLGANGAAQPAAATKLAWPVFNESQRDQAVGKWAPDVVKTSKVTILVGKYFARTTVFSGNPTVGAAMDVNNAGQLVAGSTAPVAYCVVAPRNVDYLGNTVSAIDIYVF